MILLSCPPCFSAQFWEASSQSHTTPTRQAHPHRFISHKGYGNIFSSLTVQSQCFLCGFSVPFTSPLCTAHGSLTGTFIKSHLNHLVCILFLSRPMNNSSIVTVFLKLPKCSLRILLNIVSPRQLLPLYPIWHAR